jgi:hypothetical protein
MERREVLGAFGLLAAGLVEARAGELQEPHHPMPKIHEDCMKACGDCARTCNMMAHHCMEKICAGDGPVAKHARSHTLAMDCQAFCSLAETMIARSSELMVYSCDACAEACRLCAEECEKAQGDAVMASCGRTCRQCERTCRDMVRTMKTSTGGATR